MSYIEILFLVAVAIQLVYFLLFIVAFAKKEKTAHTPAEVTPISVVVCAHDEFTNLKELVPQLLLQEYPAFEIIVVDDRSNDDTRDWLFEETKKDARLRMVHVDHTPDHINGKKYALTLGIRAAQHEWIVLTDADCRPSSEKWLTALSKRLYSDAQFVVAYSPYQKMQGWLNRFIRFETLITGMQYLGFALIKMPYMGVGRNMAYRKSLFMESKGFTNMLSLTGGDDDLYVNKHATSRNVAVALGKDALIYSLPKTTLSDFFQQKTRHLAAGKKYKFGHRIILGIFVSTWLLSWWLGIALLLLSPQPEVIGGALLLRVILLFITLHITLRRLGETFELWSLLVLDIIYTIYYITTGSVALLTKKFRWKN